MKKILEVHDLVARLAVLVELALIDAPSRLRSRRSVAADRGQATAEYALVLLGAAAVALLVVGWAAKSGKVSTLMNRVFDSIIGKVA